MDWLLMLEISWVNDLFGCDYMIHDQHWVCVRVRNTRGSVNAAGCCVKSEGTNPWQEFRGSFLLSLRVFFHKECLEKINLAVGRASG